MMLASGVILVVSQCFFFLPTCQVLPCVYIGIKWRYSLFLANNHAPGLIYDFLRQWHRFVIAVHCTSFAKLMDSLNSSSDLIFNFNPCYGQLYIVSTLWFHFFPSLICEIMPSVSNAVKCYHVVYISRITRTMRLISQPWASYSSSPLMERPASPSIRRRCSTKRSWN